MKLQAVIFDLDGVITDTAHLHFLAWREAAQELGIVIDAAFNEQLKGISRLDSLQRILEHGGRATDFTDAERQAIAARKNACYVASLTSLTPQSILPGIKELIVTLRQKGIRIGLASVSLNAPTILSALGIASLFDYCADASRVKHSKPAPDIFLVACEGLGVLPQHAVGVEDAQAGIEAINASGMASVGIGKDLQGAGLLLTSTHELNWPRLAAYWNNRNPVTEA
ncbi:beta-phosphoglucomutase [Scandinavium sp. NPDC088450]|uniref:beta-phosphoglucomutase n=1 Tax=Scandinavium sp. NPDC088450 TaxID=3364514 RepID=UPI00384F604D